MPEPNRTLEIEELAAELVNRGGSIVSSNDCTPRVIASAKRDNRFAATDCGLGFVLLLPRAQKTVVRETSRGRFAKKSLAQTDKIGTVTETV